MSAVCQRTNVGWRQPVARWLRDHGAQLVVDDRIEDAPVRYLLLRGETSAGVSWPRLPHAQPDGVVARFRTVEHFGLAIQAPGGVPWTS